MENSCLLLCGCRYKSARVYFGEVYAFFHVRSRGLLCLMPVSARNCRAQKEKRFLEAAGVFVPDLTAAMAFCL